MSKKHGQQHPLGPGTACPSPAAPAFHGRGQEAGTRLDDVNVYSSCLGPGAWCRVAVDHGMGVMGVGGMSPLSGGP